MPPAPKPAIAIDRGVPIWGTTRGHPDKGGKGGKRKYPLDKMAVGDSFAVPVTPDTLRKRMNALCSAAAYVLGPGNYTTRVTPEKDAVRLWRIS